MTANLPFLPILTYIDFLLSLHGGHILVARLVLWDRWFVVVVCVGAAAEHVVAVVEVVCCVIIVIAID